MPQALTALDPFAIALWTLVLCGIIFMIYLTLALGRFLRAVEHVRMRFDVLADQLGATARSAEAALVAKAPSAGVPAQPAGPLPSPPLGKPAAPPAPVPTQTAASEAVPTSGGETTP